MKRLLAAILACITITLAGCGDGDGTRPTFATDIPSDPAFDGYISRIVTPLTTTYTVTQGMSPTVQSVRAGIDPVSGVEYRAFLHFPLGGPGGVPGNAVIVSAYLDLFIDSISTAGTSIPILIELVSFTPPTLIASDFDRAFLFPLDFVTVAPPIGAADVGNYVTVDVTRLMAAAQDLGLPDCQLRILEDFGFASPGVVEINDTTGSSRDLLAPLLSVTYF